MSKQVGSFSLDVWGPYPCTVVIEHRGERFSFRHDELRDLEYLVASAIRECNQKLYQSMKQNIDGLPVPKPD